MIYSDSTSQFGAGNGDIWLDDVACIGNEDSIFQCKILLDNHDCDHNQDVGIQCTNDTKTGAIRVKLYVVFSFIMDYVYYFMVCYMVYSYLSLTI